MRPIIALAMIEKTDIPKNKGENNEKMAEFNRLVALRI